MPYYGYCVIKNELVEESPSFLMNNKNNKSDKLNEENYKPSYIVAPRCYCLISDSPFFQVHFSVLLNLMSQDHVNRISLRMLPEMTDNNNNNTSNTVIDILKSYYSLKTPLAGETNSFKLPNDIYTTTIYNPIGDAEAKLIADWTLVVTCKILSLENLLTVYTAGIFIFKFLPVFLIFQSIALLEKPIIFVCKNLSTLSCVT